ncbi:hypothetical protein Tco_0528894 [Tanacetum coccineum]
MLALVISYGSLFVIDRGGMLATQLHPECGCIVMAGQTNRFASMAGQINTFAAKAGQLIRFAAMGCVYNKLSESGRMAESEKRSPQQPPQAHTDHGFRTVLGLGDLFVAAIRAGKSRIMQRKTDLMTSVVMAGCQTGGGGAVYAKEGQSQEVVDAGLGFKMATAASAVFSVSLLSIGFFFVAVVTVDLAAGNKGSGLITFTVDSNSKDGLPDRIRKDMVWVCEHADMLIKYTTDWVSLLDTWRETKEKGHSSRHEALSTMMQKEALRASGRCRIAIATCFEKLNMRLQEAVLDNREDQLATLRKIQQNAHLKNDIISCLECLRKSIDERNSISSAHCSDRLETLIKMEHVE